MVTVNQRYQIVIPQSVRAHLGIRPGQQVQVIAYDDRIVVIPVRPARELRGFLADHENTFERGEDRL
jgi:AbrB family looped-hinge helix DNA binding protein